MKKIILILITLLLFTKLSSQNKIDLHLPKAQSTSIKLKLSLRTSIDPEKVNDRINSTDDIPYSQIVAYNLRLRLNCTPQLKVYIGNETITNSFRCTYIGFIKKFPKPRKKLIIVD